jgi:3-keto-5-aminohexanoate cleavage enzyme
MSREGSKPIVIGVHVNENTPRHPNPHVPWTPIEIAQTAKDCEAAGASVMHFHARTDDGGPEHSAERYAQTVAAVRDRSGILLAPSLANVPGYDADQRLSNLRPNQCQSRTRVDFLVADMGCANMDLFDCESREFTSENRVFINDTRTQRQLLQEAPALGLKPYLASFNVSWTRTILAHATSGLVSEPIVIAFILGGKDFLAAHPVSPAGLRAQLDLLPDGTHTEWIVSAYRGNLLNLADEVITRGGHLAIGVGDYAYPEWGYPSTPELVERVADMARSHGREPATVDEARRILGVTN